MHPTYRFLHTKGYQAQRYRCPLLFPQRTGETCQHEQFLKDKGCVKDINIEKGGLMRAMLNRSSPLYRAVYRQRTSAERINSQAKARCIERPKVRQGHSVKRLNTLPLPRHQRQSVGTCAGHQRFLAHAQLDAGIEAFRRLAQGRSCPFLNAPAVGVADPAVCHWAWRAGVACMTRVQAQGRRKIWSAVLMNERQNQQKQHHRHVDFHSNDSQVSTRIIRATASIWKRALTKSNRWNDSTPRILPTLEREGRK